MAERLTEISRLLEQLGRSAYAEAFSEGLNPAQWAGLRYFANANRFSRTVSAFAAYHGTTLGTASQTVKSLVDKGVIERKADPDDKRRQQVFVSQAGEELLRHDPLDILARAAASLSEGEREAMNEGMRKMLQAIANERGDTCFGACANCGFLESGDTADAKPGCRLVNETLHSDELDKICVNFQVRSSG